MSLFLVISNQIDFKSFIWGLYSLILLLLLLSNDNVDTEKYFRRRGIRTSKHVLRYFSEMSTCLPLFTIFIHHCHKNLVHHLVKIYVDRHI